MKSDTRMHGMKMNAAPSCFLWKEAYSIHGRLRDLKLGRTETSSVQNRIKVRAAWARFAWIMFITVRCPRPRAVDDQQLKIHSIMIAISQKNAKSLVLRGSWFAWIFKSDLSDRLIARWASAIFDIVTLLIFLAVSSPDNKIYTLKIFSQRTENCHR